MAKKSEKSEKPNSTKTSKKTLDQLEAELAQAQDQTKRALADYQNLVRRTQEEKVRMAQLANRRLIEDILQPLDHLNLAATQLDDSGLQMVVDQLWEALQRNGLEKINPLKQPFDVETMEAIETKGNGNMVVAVQSPGYTLYGNVIRHAKVIVE